MGEPVPRPVPFLLLACFGLALGLGVEAARIQPQDGLALLRQWLDTVELHVPGSVDGPLIGAAGWSGAELDQLWVDTQALAKGALAPGRYNFSITPHAIGQATRVPRPVTRSIERGDRAAFDALTERVRLRGLNVVLHRAALLHTDVIFEAADVAQAAGANSGRIGRRWSIGDGASLGTEGLSLHLEMARLLLGMVTPDPRGDPFVRDWYRATIAAQQSAEYFDSLQLTRGLRLFPDDPDLLLMAGAEREAMASPMFQAFARSIVSRYNLTGISSTSRELDDAEDFYRRALKVRPEFAEARVRLGRVLARQGEHAASVGELQAALDTGLDSTHEYYAWLFVGAAREALGEADAALDAYREASERSVAARAPLLAIARLARERGDRPLVTESLARALVPLGLDDPIDPLWLYRAVQGRRRAGLLDELRRRAGKDRP